jgi:capsular polysaccharide biosynthesis protein
MRTQIERSGLFDPAFYEQRSPAVTTAGLDPLTHYLTTGAALGLDPHPLFDTAFYLDCNPDVTAAGVNPLWHYLNYGAAENRDPHPLFSIHYYREHNPDVTAAGVEPLTHYLNYGAAEGRDPHPFFDTSFYLDRNPELRTARVNPLVHYVNRGAREGRRIHPEDPDLPGRIRSFLREGKFDLAAAYYHLYASQCPSQPVLRIRLRAPVQSVHDYLRASGTLLYHCQPEDIRIPEPTFCHPVEGDWPAVNVRLPPEYVGVLNDVFLIGGTRVILTQEGVLLHDELSCLTPEYGIKPHHIVLYVRDGVAAVRSALVPGGSTDEGILLSCDHDPNYFHWVAECLAKLMMVNSIPELSSLPLLISDTLHPNLIRALEVINAGARPIVRLRDGLVHRVKTLIYPSDVSRILDHYHGALDLRADFLLSPRRIAEAVDCIRGRTWAYKGKPFRKLYLTRRNARVRLLRNEAEVELLLLRQGFEIVELTGRSFDAQVALFSQAACIVAPCGAALTNLLFCQPGTRVLAFQSSHPCSNRYIFSHLAHIAGVDLRSLLCPAGDTIHEDTHVDLDLLQAGLEFLLR